MYREPPVNAGPAKLLVTGVAEYWFGASSLQSPAAVRTRITLAG